MVAHSPAGGFSRRFSGARFHHFPRLRAWFIFQIAESQSHFRSDYWLAHFHAVLLLALGTFGASFKRWRSGSAWDRRCVDTDCAGVFGIVSLETLCLSVGAQPGSAVRARA